MRAAEERGQETSEPGLGLELFGQARFRENKRSGGRAAERVNQWARKEFEGDHCRDRISGKSKKILPRLVGAPEDHWLPRLNLCSGKEKLSVKFSHYIF